MKLAWTMSTAGKTKGELPFNASSSTGYESPLSGLWWINPGLLGTSAISVCRSSSLEQKYDRNWTENNCGLPDVVALILKILVDSCEVSWKNGKTKKDWSRLVATGIWSWHGLDLTHTHIYLIFALSHQNGQESIEIWPKTFLYTIWMYVSSVFTISQPNHDGIA